MGLKVISPKDLKAVASSYTYDEREFRPLEQVLWNRMQSYAGPFGQTIIEHLSRTSMHLDGALGHFGHNKTVRQNLSHAFRLHDAGKVLQDVSLWGLEYKPSDEVRKQRPEHTNLGVTFLDDVLKDFPHLRDHPHTGIIASFMKYHHERINGKGPQGLSGNELGDILEIAGIVDCVDGKSILRVADKNLRPSDIEKLIKEKARQALLDMTGLPAYTNAEKHRGEFSEGLLLSLIPHYEKSKNIIVLPPITPLPQPALAL